MDKRRGAGVRGGSRGHPQGAGDAGVGRNYDGVGRGSNGGPPRGGNGGSFRGGVGVSSRGGNGGTPRGGGYAGPPRGGTSGAPRGGTGGVPRGGNAGPGRGGYGRGAARSVDNNGLEQRPSTSQAAQQRAPVTQSYEAPSNNSGDGLSGSPDSVAGGVLSVVNRATLRGRRVLPDMIVTRPSQCVTKMGKSGQSVNLQTNYFKLLKTPKWIIHQYRVDFSPDVDLITIRRAYLAHHKETLGGYLFDGTVLFCTKHLVPQMENNILELLTKNREGETIQIKIKHVGIVESTDAQQLQVLNLILRRAMAGLNLHLIGRNFFDPVAKVNLDNHFMEIWPGYQTSIRQHEADILLCAEIAHKVMRTDTLYKILSQCSESSDYQSSFKREAIGMIVLTDYNNKTYRVDDVDFQMSPKSTFSTKDGESSFIEYYKRRYNINIRDSSQPLLISRPTERNIRAGEPQIIMLIPELCRATGLTDHMRKNFRLMAAMSEHTRLNPNRRIDRLMAFNKRLQMADVSRTVLNSWDMRLDTNLVAVPGRILPSQKILFGNKGVYMCDAQADWSREFRNNPMRSHRDIKRWFVIVPRRFTNETQQFVQMCIRVARGMKMQIMDPQYEEMNDDRTGTYASTIEKVAVRDPEILMVVVGNNNEDKYNCIKKKCCVDRPMPSQVICLNTVAPRGNKAGGLMSIATKVVIQMNAKLGGAPWMIEIPLKGLMTVGFDVCHSGKERNKSIGALVATMDMQSSARYFSAATQHQKGQELSNEISLHMNCALKTYMQVHGALPERILFYRDGVGDGQLHQVFNTEVDAIKKVLDTTYAAHGITTGCRLAFVVVSKGINTRYFVSGQNPAPGTVVDDIITLPERYDFFLVSQCVRQGTVSPTNYNVIYDNMGLDADKLQILTYKMTHMYYNWAGTCRVPAVCQYAHKLAFLVAEHINRPPSNSLENQLYFL